MTPIAPISPSVSNAESGSVASGELYRRVFEDCPDYVSLSRVADGTLIEVNPGFERFSGWRRDEVVGRPSVALGIWPYPEERAGFVDRLQREGSVRGYPCHLASKTGEIHPVEVAGSIAEMNGEAVLVAVVRDVTERRLAERAVQDHREQLEQLVAQRTEALRQAHETLQRTLQQLRDSEREARFRAQHDPLTGLPNRALLLDRLQQAVAAAPRRGDTLALLFIDLDDFKHVNDSLGHQAGDEVLCSVATRLLGCVRRSDTVARLGGDEFVVAIAGRDAGPYAAEVATKVLNALHQPIAVQGRQFHTFASIGIAVYPDDGQTAGALMQAADTAMYHAKAQGKNNFQFHSPALQQAALRRYVIDHELREALREGQFVLHYQPKVSLEDARVLGFEALLRWHHPALGVVPPLDFIGLAEQTGQIVPIGEWALREACTQLRRWRDAGRPELRVAVNVSPRQLWQPGFAERVAEVLAACALPGDALDLEITEGMLMQPTDESLAAMERIAALGVRLHVDDFGTGYSSLSYLARYPIHALKIDRTFVNEITESPRAKAITSTIVAMAGQLGLDVVAEGVETQAQAAALRALGCEIGQGWLYGWPVEAGEVPAVLGLPATEV